MFQPKGKQNRVGRLGQGSGQSGEESCFQPRARCRGSLSQRPDSSVQKKKICAQAQDVLIKSLLYAWGIPDPRPRPLLIVENNTLNSLALS